MACRRASASSLQIQASRLPTQSIELTFPRSSAAQARLEAVEKPQLRNLQRFQPIDCTEGAKCHNYFFLQPR